MTEASAPELALAAIAENLSRLGRSYALIGGLAVSVRGEIRFTRDVDLIAERRFERGQDLRAKLEELIQTLHRPE